MRAISIAVLLFDECSVRYTFVFTWVPYGTWLKAVWHLDLMVLVVIQNFYNDGLN